jgi:hypothetical protein
VSHDFHEKISLLLGGRALWKNLDSLRNLLVELFNVLQLLDRVVHQKADVGVDPNGYRVLKLLDEGSGVHSQPSDVYGGLHCVNIVLDIGQEGDLLIESVKVWFPGLDSLENFLGHPLEGFVLLFFAISVDSDVLLLPWVNSGVQESVETLLESLFPKELLVLVLVNEILCSLHDVVELVGHILHGSEQLELILDLNQVVTSVGVKSWHLNGDGDEVIQDLLNDISDSVTLRVALD